MNILVIGNGFDLAHNLKTSYKDFLTFAKCVMEKDLWLGNDSDLIKGYPAEFVSFINTCNKTRVFPESKIDFLQEFTKLTKGNLWIEHFMNIHPKEGWVDFEKEISLTIQEMDWYRKKLSDDKVVLNNSFRLLKPDYFRNPEELGLNSLFDLKKRLLKDLNNLTLALELYLAYFVEGVQLKGTIKKRDDVVRLGCGKLISFNYTNTFEKIYDTRFQNEDFARFFYKEEYNYIHGKVKKEPSPKTCNLVLGIGEYLGGPEKDDDNYFVEFKKFFQRIYKKTGSKYKKWLSYVEQNNKNRNEKDKEILDVYFYGHSLDVTDKDIIRDLITFETAKTTIFYHNREALESYISNLVKILGEDDLIARTGEDNKSIFFVPLNPDEFEAANGY